MGIIIIIVVIITITVCSMVVYIHVSYLICNGAFASSGGGLYLAAEGGRVTTLTDHGVLSLPEDLCHPFLCVT